MALLHGAVGFLRFVNLLFHGHTHLLFELLILVEIGSFSTYQATVYTDTENIRGAG